MAGLEAPARSEIPGGSIVLDSNGAPTGVLEERAQTIVQELILPRSINDIVDALDRATAVYAREGITSFTEAGIAGGWIGHSPLEFAAYQQAHEKGVLRSRAQVMIVSDVLGPALAHRDDPHQRALHAGIRTGLGDEWLSIGPMKIFLDGSMLAWTGAMSEPFAAGAPDNYGYFQGELEDLSAMILGATGSGWSVGAHAIGDRAVDLALTAFEEAIARYGRPRIPHRIEHGGVVTDEQAARAAALGVAIITQPGFMPELGIQMREAMGPTRSPLIHRHRGLMKHGVMVAGSSHFCIDKSFPGAGDLLPSRRMCPQNSTSFMNI
jgi:predicted amidohydrolase YtcJ